MNTDTQDGLTTILYLVNMRLFSVTCRHVNGDTHWETTREGYQRTEHQPQDDWLISLMIKRFLTHKPSTYADSIA